MKKRKNLLLKQKRLNKKLDPIKKDKNEKILAV